MITYTRSCSFKDDLVAVESEDRADILASLNWKFDNRNWAVSLHRNRLRTC